MFEKYWVIIASVKLFLWNWYHCPDKKWSVFKEMANSDHCQHKNVKRLLRTHLKHIRIKKLKKMSRKWYTWAHLIHSSKFVSNKTNCLDASNLSMPICEFSNLYYSNKLSGEKRLILNEFLYRKTSVITVKYFYFYFVFL